jgi:hypothetical protein
LIAILQILHFTDSRCLSTSRKAGLRREADERLSAWPPRHEKGVSVLGSEPHLVAVTRTTPARVVGGQRFPAAQAQSVRNDGAAARQLACDLTLESGVLVSVFVADPTFVEQHEGYSFIEAVRQEGIRV